MQNKISIEWLIMSGRKNSGWYEYKRSTKNEMDEDEIGGKAKRDRHEFLSTTLGTPDTHYRGSYFYLLGWTARMGSGIVLRAEVRGRLGRRLVSASRRW